MGNSVGKEAQDMGVVVISHVIQSGRSELMALRRRILMMKQDKKGHMIARGEYQDAAQFVVIDPSDCEVFDRLLTLFDKTGDGRVMWKELMVGCACIINASFEDRLLVAMELYDEEKSGQLARQRGAPRHQGSRTDVRFLRRSEAQPRKERSSSSLAFLPRWLSYLGEMACRIRTARDLMPQPPDDGHA